MVRPSGFPVVHSVFEILLGNSYSKVTDGDGVQTAYGQVPIDGTWIHVAATISGTAGSTNGTGKLYVNGNLVGSKTNMYVPATLRPAISNI